MSEAGVVYADVKFKDKRRAQQHNNAFSEDETTYSEVKINKTPQNDPPEGSCGTGSAGGSKVSSGGCNRERAALVVLSVILAAALAALGFLYNDNMQTKQHLQIMTAKHDAVKKNLTDTLSQPKKCDVVQPSCRPPTEGGTCFKCDPDWERHGNKCYRFLTEKLTWDQSRSRCEELGGHLVKIDSKDEQCFLDWTLIDKMDEAEDKFWIGLTDQVTEDEWLWVDGSKLDESLAFWNYGEPDNWREKNPDGEDCARMGEKGGAPDLKCWRDQDCNKPQKGVCEKTPSMGRVKFNCE
ncbi:C-type lectin domain family 4 member E-like isoform X1 [Myripristis murdjan]|uniref:C-type lectin domain family 4 member E-like isoform X1 n=1 Tax=Myripristis murdjan TaxID=586833 RepID=UPI00117614EB|nr:C-type lectin domain family 4 member E-like isoform X1 [Myripristis murdjan]